MWHADCTMVEVEQKREEGIVNWKTPIMGLGLSGLMAGTAVAQGPPMNTETAFVVGLNGGAFRTFVQTVRKSKLLQDGSRISDPLDREVQVVATPLIFPYELIPNRLVVGAGIPYLDKEMRLTRDGVKRSLSDRGFGDLTLFAKYQLLQWDALKKTTRVTFKSLLKLPTGEHEATDGEGNRLPRGIQLGTGTVDYAVGLIFTHIVNRLGINADTFYRFNGETEGFEFGDAVNYDLALGYRIYPSVYETYPSPYATVYLEANGQFNRKSRAAGQRVADSGGHTLFLSPGVQYIPLGNLILETSIQIPVRQELNGTQLGTDFVFKGGIRWLIF